LAIDYEHLGDKGKATEMYLKAIDHEVISAYAYLAMLYREEGDEANYRKWMREGMNHGNGLCCTLDADMTEEEFQALPEDEQDNLFSAIDARLAVGVVRCEGVCAYLQAVNYYSGTLGFEQDLEAAIQAAERGYDLGDPSCCTLIADMSEKDEEANTYLGLDDGQRAFMRLEALRFGDDSQLDVVVKAYHKGLFEGTIAEEVEREWLPKFKLTPLPKLVKDEMEPTVLVIHPDGYAEYMEADISKFHFMDPFKEIGELIDAADTRNVTVTQPLRDITETVDLEEGQSVAMFYDIDAEKKGLKVNPVATKLNGGEEMRGAVVIALEGDFVPMDCNDSGYRPVYSFTFYDDITAVFDEIYDLVGGQLYTDDDLEDDDGRYDPYA